MLNQTLVTDRIDAEVLQATGVISGGRPFNSPPPAVLTAAATEAETSERRRDPDGARTAGDRPRASDPGSERAPPRREAPEGRDRSSGPLWPTALTFPTKAGVAGPWFNSTQNPFDLDRQVRKGMFVRCWLEGQPSLKTVKTPSMATFYVMERGAMMNSGFDMDVMVVGARAPTLLTALEEGPFPRNLTAPGRHYLHACTAAQCVQEVTEGDPTLIRSTLNRVHAIAFEVAFREEVTERWCVEGLATLDRELQRGAPLPPYRKPIDLGKDKNREKAEKERLSAQVGPPGDGQSWESGRLRDRTAPPSSAATFRPDADEVSGQGAKHFRPAEDAEPPAFPPPPPVGDVDTAYSRALQDARDSQAQHDAARLRLDREVEEARKKSRELDTLVQRTQDRLAELESTRHQGGQAPGNRNSPSRAGRSRDRREAPVYHGRRPDSAPPYQSNGEREVPGYTLPDRRVNPQDPRLPLPPSIRMDGFSHGHFEGDLMGRKAGTYGDQVPTFKTQEVLTWLQAQFDYSNKCREVAMNDLKERRRRDRLEKREERFGPGNHRRRDERSDEEESEEERDTRSAGFGQAGDPHRFRTLARESPGVLFATLVAEYRGQLGQHGYDMDVGPHGPVFRKWAETVFPQHPKYHKQRWEGVQEEFESLIFALDELRCGRILELADILAQRLRQLCLLIETNNKAVAGQLLPYQKRQFASMSNEAFDAAVDLAEKEQKRARKLNRLTSR